MITFKVSVESHFKTSNSEVLTGQIHRRLNNTKKLKSDRVSRNSWIPAPQKSLQDLFAPRVFLLEREKKLKGSFNDDKWCYFYEKKMLKLWAIFHTHTKRSSIPQRLTGEFVASQKVFSLVSKVWQIRKMWKNFS